MNVVRFAFLAALAPACLGAQAPDSAPAPIQDNSFLVEEAYNQDPGVVQHISTMELTRPDVWAYTFTQEWPVGGLSNQLSYTIPVMRGTGAYSGMRIGDVALNYRYQLVGGGDTKVAVSPRLTVMLPTGNHSLGTGAGTETIQFDLPASFVLTPTLVTHSNLGWTRTPSVVTNGVSYDASNALNAAQSLIWLPRPLFNVMLEAVYTHTAVGSASTSTTILSPGIRWGYNFASGLQIVPGIAMPFTFTQGARSTRGAILYLSFEHPFMHVEDKS